MTKERLKQIFLLNLKRGTRNRAEYLKTIFYEVGDMLRTSQELSHFIRNSLSYTTIS